MTDLREDLAPLWDWCIFRIDKDAQGLTAGGLHIPGVRKSNEVKRAEVLSIGSGPFLINGQEIELAFGPGDHVLLGKHAGAPLYADDDSLVLAKAGDVRAVVK